MEDTSKMVSCEFHFQDKMPCMKKDWVFIVVLKLMTKTFFKLATALDFSVMDSLMDTIGLPMANGYNRVTYGQWFFEWGPISFATTGVEWWRRCGANKFCDKYHGSSQSFSTCYANYKEDMAVLERENEKAKLWHSS